MKQTAGTLPAASTLSGGAVVLVAEPGEDRDAIVDNWLERARQSGFATWRVSGHVEEIGVWAGLSDLLESILPRMRAVAPQLVERHAYELCLVLPSLRRELTVKNPCLTDVANDDEKVRNYPSDRIYRTLHGLVDLLSDWNRLEPSLPWAIACDHFDRATPLVQRFFAELVRRRGKQLGLALLLAVAPESSTEPVELFDPRTIEVTLRLRLRRGFPPVIDAAVAAEQASQLEAIIGEDKIEWRRHIPRLIRLWQLSHEPERALPWLVRAIHIYDHDGLYEVSLRYAGAVEANLRRMHELNPRLHAAGVLNLFFCYAALGLPERALHVLETEGLSRIQELRPLIDVHYFLAMLHARFLPIRDQDQAAWHLDQGMALIQRLDTSEAQRHFLSVFNRNGLAYVRLKQGRPNDALELCRAGLAELDQYLDPTQHRLHRSVLLYNAAQVLAGLEHHDEAIDFLSRAMDLDPNYSEYYLERGGLHLKRERYLEAERDLLQAIELSPPYPEVWTALGQCYRASGRPGEAVQAYSRALDLDPNVSLALIGRAECLVELGRIDTALADYSAALALDPDQGLVLAGRAVAYFEAGQTAAALADLNRAIELAPGMPELYQNRAIALREMGNLDKARADLRRYLELMPHAEDRAEVEAQLAELGANQRA